MASLCSNFSEALRDIAEGISQQATEFLLRDQISQQTLDENLVFVSVKNPGESEFRPIERDTSRTNGWDYNATNNSVVLFGEAIPVEGAEVSVTFDRQEFN